MGTLSVQSPFGASRSLTEVFILLRNNASQSKHIFTNPSAFLGKEEEHLSLVPLHDDNNDDVEAGLNGKLSSSRIPPEWVNIIDEIQFEMARIEGRLVELKEMQQRHITRPSFNDYSSQQDEAKIATATQAITTMFGHCQRLLGIVKHYERAYRPSKRVGYMCKESDELLLRNVISSMVLLLQKRTVEFRISQTRYLKQMETREDNFQQYFGDYIAESSSSDLSMETKIPSNSMAFSFDEPAQTESFAGPLSMVQIQQLSDNVKMVKEREQEILHITKSIVDLNTLFKDLAAFVMDQGTILDRIDYNIEQSLIRVKSGLNQVQKAKQYQGKSRKMRCIVCLSVSIVVLLILLIFTKS